MRLIPLTTRSTKKRVPTPVFWRNQSDRNWRKSSFEKGGTDVGDQEKDKINSRPKQHDLLATLSSGLSTGFYRKSEVYSPVDNILHLSIGFYRKSGDYSPVDITLHLSTA